MLRIQLTLGCASVAKYSIKGIIRNKTRGCGGGLTHTLRDTCENNSFNYYQASPPLFRGKEQVKGGRRGHGEGWGGALTTP